jgi:hypothetical protein
LPGLLRLFAVLLQTMLACSPEAAETPVFLAQSERAIGTGGKFYPPRIRELTIPQRAQNLERREMLWAAGEELVAPYLNSAETTAPSNEAACRTSARDISALR